MKTWNKEEEAQQRQKKNERTQQRIGKLFLKGKTNARKKGVRERETKINEPTIRRLEQRKKRERRNRK